MKRIVFAAVAALLIGGPLGAAESMWEGCGSDAAEAKLRLAENIQTKVDSEFVSDKSSIDFYGLSNLFFSETSHRMKQTSTVVLQDVQIEPKDETYCESRTGRLGGCYCASVSKESLFSFTKSLKEKVLAYDLAALPAYEKQKVIKLKEWLDEMRYARSLMSVYPDRFSAREFKAMEQMEKRLLDSREQYHAQFVKIAIIGDKAELRVDGKVVQPDTELFLKPGKHHYEVSSKQSCPAEGEFELLKDTDRILTVDLSTQRYPTILISSNKMAAVTLEIDGKRMAAGTRHTIPRCSGDIRYTLSYRDAGNTQTEGEVVHLKPGLEVEESYTFYSEKEMAEMRKLAGSFADGERIEILYGYSYLPDDILGYDESYEGIQMVQLNYMHTRKWLRHGYGIAYGTSGEADASYELVYSLAIQLSSIGANNRPLHLGTWVSIVPFIGLQAGLGSHQYYIDASQSTLKTFRKEATEEEDDFVRDHVIARVYGGVDLAFNAYMSLQLYAKKNFTMEENTIFGAGLSLKLP